MNRRSWKRGQHVILLLSLAASCSLAQNPTQTFQWKFSDSTIAGTLQSCQALPITLDSVNSTTNGTAPWYMISYPVGQIPITVPLGGDANRLSWTSIHPVGTELLLNLVDSSGSTGGVPPQVFTVIAGGSTACIQRPAPTSFKLTSNVTGDIETCQPWGFRVFGGVPPYQITLAQPDSTVVTNLTFDRASHDAFTYINRGSANNEILAAISDSAGVWASGVVLLNAVGSTDVSCAGLRSSSSTSAILDGASSSSSSADTGRSGSASSSSTSTSASSSSSQVSKPVENTGTGARINRALVVGVVVGAVVWFVFIIALIFFYRRRRKKQQTALEPFMADKHVQGYGYALSRIQSQSDNALNRTPNRSAHTLTHAPSQSDHAFDHMPRQFGHEFHEIPSKSRRQSRRNLPTMDSTTNVSSSATSPRSYTDTTTEESRSPDSIYESALASSQILSSRSAGRGRHRSRTRPQPHDSVISEVVVQHYDGGRVRDLPPPYADRRVSSDSTQ